MQPTLHHHNGQQETRRCKCCHQDRCHAVGRSVTLSATMSLSLPLTLATVCHTCTYLSIYTYTTYTYAYAYVHVHVCCACVCVCVLCLCMCMCMRVRVVFVYVYVYAYVCACACACVGSVGAGACGGQGGSLERRRAIVHALAHIESWAIDLAWDAVARFGWREAMPRQFFEDFAVVAEDEARHCTALAHRLEVRPPQERSHRRRGLELTRADERRVNGAN